MMRRTGRKKTERRKKEKKRRNRKERKLTGEEKGRLWALGCRATTTGHSSFSASGR